MATIANVPDNSPKGEHPGGDQEPPTSLPLPPTSREDLRLFKEPPCREGTIHLQTSMSSPGFEPGPNGTAVSVSNPYAGWVTGNHVNHSNELQVLQVNAK
ncbi:hypothetical protein TNCV_1669941 [Trichonephila clavipes]|nr:hypothetical protein TNCV_1669941 [Trichonephila clavipes]